MASAAVFNPFAPASINSHDATLLKSILDEPVNFKEVTAVVGTVDPSGKGWVEVNPVKQAKGGKQLNGVQGAYEREQPIASSSSSSTHAAPASTSSKGKAKVIYDKPIPLNFPALKSKIGSGFHNTGNSCYANSVLQAVIHTPGFANYVQDPIHKPFKECPIPKNKKFADHCQHCAIRAVVHNSFNLGKPAYTPTAITNNLKKIGKTLRKGRQEDAHEFLRFLIDGLQNVALAPYGDPNKIPVDFKYTTGIHQLFGGRLRSRVQCTRCKHNSDTFDAFLDLSIEVRGCRSVRGGFEKFVKPDTLDGQNKYKCEKCNKLVVATKGLKIQSAPKALMVQLRRFTPTGGKINDVVAYDKTFDISPFMAEGQPGYKYSLYAVVCHSGSGPHSGHYTSRVKSIDGSRWYVMDDSSVYPMDKVPLGLRDAYLLMYVREKGSSLEEAIGPVSVASTGGQAAKVNGLRAESSSANGNKKRRVSAMPDEEALKPESKVPSPLEESSNEESEEDADTTLRSQQADEEEEDNDDDDGEDLGFQLRGPLALPSSSPTKPSPVKETHQLVARKKARLATVSPASLPSLPPPVTGQGLGPRPLNFDLYNKSGSSGGHDRQSKKDKKRMRNRMGWKDPFGLSSAGKGANLTKGVGKRMKGRP